MSSNRRFLLAAVGVALSTPALAKEADVKPPRLDAAVEAPLAPEEPTLVSAEEAAVDAYALGFLDLSMCEVTTANTKGPSYDAACLADLNR